MGIDLSSRALAAVESATLKIASRAKSMIKNGVDVISLSTGEPDFDTPVCAKQAAIDAINTNFTHYTDSNGIYELRAAVAEKFRMENALSDATAETVIITTGAKQALMDVLGAICNPGDEVIVFAPYWVSYPAMVTLNGATPVILSAGIDAHFKITAAQLAQALTPRTKCVIINSPNNPTGIMYTPEELQEFASVLADHSCYVMSDEIYEKIHYRTVKHCSIGSFDSLKGRVITVNGVSKAYAMTGWRIGFLHGPISLLCEAGKVQGQTTSNPNSIAQIASLAALMHGAEDVEKMRTSFEHRKRLICSLLSEIPGVRFLEPDGAFYVFVDISQALTPRVSTSAAFCEVLLETYHLALVPGEAFGAGGFVRFSFAAAEETIVKALVRFKKCIEELGN